MDDQTHITKIHAKIMMERYNYENIRHQMCPPVGWIHDQILPMNLECGVAERRITEILSRTCATPHPHNLHHHLGRSLSRAINEFWVWNTQQRMTSLTRYIARQEANIEILNLCCCYISTLYWLRSIGRRCGLK